MKLIIQIPAYNEAEFLPAAIQSLPKALVGIDEIEYLVIDDGSTDGTAQIARDLGVGHVLQLTRNTGLASAFMSGIEYCLHQDADIIVNTDADNQYNAEDIQALIDPILNNRADIVVGDRGIATLENFSASKRLLQRFGSWVIARASGVDTPDAASGFRAINRDAALRTLVLSEYSYTLETLIQAGSRQMRVSFVPVRTNPQSRPSRLMRGLPHYMTQSGATVLRAYTMYRPLRVFSILAALIIMVGLIFSVRYLYFFLNGKGAGHVQSLLLAAVLIIVGFQVLLIGLVADLIGFNRKILEEILYRFRKFELESKQPDQELNVKKN